MRSEEVGRVTGRPRKSWTIQEHVGRETGKDLVRDGRARKRSEELRQE